MDKKGISRIVCHEAPPAIGPYSQAVSAQGFVFVSGQIPVDSRTGEVTRGGIKEQTAKVIDNVERILLSCGMALSNVVKVEVFLSDIRDFADMNDVYASRFNGDIKPARYVVQAAGLPKNVGIEISCTAYGG